MKWLTNKPIDSVHVDPYFHWAQATNWRGFRRLLGKRLGTGDLEIETVRVLVQAADAQAAWEAMQWPIWTVAPVYWDCPYALRHFVAEVAYDDLEILADLPESVHWELSIPFRDAETAARAQTIGEFGETSEATQRRPESVIGVDAPSLESQLQKIDADVVMAVIDFGCPFMNEVFRRDHAPGGVPRTRVEALWDQGSTRNPVISSADGRELPWPWSDASDRMGYGRVMRGPTMDAIMSERDRRAELYAQGNPEGRLWDESEVYRRIDYLINYDDARQRVWVATHGSHVTATAAGMPDPLLGHSADPDAAGAAPIVFVQLPALTAADSAGGSLSAQVLDAVHYVLDVCKPDAKIVVTLSYGSFAGPHNGTSLVEQALDELIAARRKNLAIVLGAGNAHQAACHVARSIAVKRSALLRLHLDPGDFTDTFVETWFEPGESQIGLVRARARSAEGDWSPWVRVGECTQMYHSDDVRPMARLSFQPSVPNGEGALLLLAVAPTARPADDDGPLAPAGSWQIEVDLEPGVDIRAEDLVHFNAWVERDDPGWLGHGAQPRFEEQRFGDADQTLSSLATGRYTVIVGGFRLADGVPALYSSAGLRDGPPLIYGACEESEALPTIQAAGVRSSDTLRMSGTSVATPVMARRIYNHLHAGGNVKYDRWEAALRRIIDKEVALAKDERRPSVLRHGGASEQRLVRQAPRKRKA